MIKHGYVGKAYDSDNEEVTIIGWTACNKAVKKYNDGVLTLSKNLDDYTLEPTLPSYVATTVESLKHRGQHIKIGEGSILLRKSNEVRPKKRTQTVTYWTMERVPLDTEVTDGHGNNHYFTKHPFIKGAYVDMSEKKLCECSTELPSLWMEKSAELPVFVWLKKSAIINEGFNIAKLTPISYEPKEGYIPYEVESAQTA